MPEPDDLAELPKKSFRGYVETEELCAITSRETRIDPHTVNLLVMRAFRSLSRSLRQAFLVEDAEQRHEMLMQWFRESLSEKGLEIDVREGDDYAARSRQVKRLVDQMHALYEGVRGVAAEKAKPSEGSR